MKVWIFILVAMFVLILSGVFTEHPPSDCPAGSFKSYNWTTDQAGVRTYDWTCESYHTR